MTRHRTLHMLTAIEFHNKTRRQTNRSPQNLRADGILTPTKAPTINLFAPAALPTISFALLLRTCAAHGRARNTPSPRLGFAKTHPSARGGAILSAQFALILSLFPAWARRRLPARCRGRRRSRRRGNGRAWRAPAAIAPPVRSAAHAARACCSASVGAPPSRASVTTQRVPVHSLSFCARSPASVRGARALGRNSIRPGSRRTRCMSFSICTFRTGAPFGRPNPRDPRKRTQDRQRLAPRIRFGRGSAAR